MEGNQRKELSMCSKLNIQGKRFNWGHLLGFLIVLVCGLKLTYGLQYVMDFFILDETNYMVRGSNFLKKMPTKWGPLYCMWYQLGYFIEQDLFKLFYANFKLISIVPFLAFYLVLAVFGFGPFISTLSSSFFMAATINLPTYPKVSHFSLLVIFLALVLIKLVKSHYLRAVVLVFTAVLLSYARPEFYLSAICALPIALGLAFVAKRKPSFFEVKMATVAIAFIVLLHVFWRFPLGIKLHGESRSLIAFGEHFAYNYSQWEGIDQYLWLGYDKILSEHFGEVSSLSEVVKSNPAMFKKHILSNISNFFKSSLINLKETFWLYNNSGKNINLLAIIISLIFIMMLLVRRFIPPKLTRELKDPILLIALFIFSIPSIISAILVYPRDHYLIIHLPFFIVAILFVLSPRVNNENYSKISLLSLIFLAPMLIIAFPKAGDYEYFPLRKEEKVLNNQMVFSLFKSLDIKEDFEILGNEGNFNFILGKNYKWIRPLIKRDVDFISFIKEKQPEVIYCTTSLFKNPWYANDPSWLEFIEAPQNFGFYRVELSAGIKEYLLFEESFYQQVKDKIPSEIVPYSKKY